MNLVYQIIERDSNQTVTVRFTTDKVPAAALDPQMENGAPKQRADGLVARCQGDLCIWLPSPEPTGAALQTLLTKYAPKAVLHAAELLVDANATTTLETVTALAEQSVVLS